MNKILLIGSKDAETKNNATDIVTAIGSDLSENASVQVVYYEDLVFSISNDEVKVIDAISGMDLADAKLIVAMNWYKNGKKSLYRDVAFTIALYLKSHNIKFWNSEMAMQRSTSKLSAMMQLALQGMPIPATLFSLNSALVQKREQTFPVIVKAAAASRGASNYLCKSPEEMSKLLQTAGDMNEYIVQEYIPNDSDLRIICFGGQPAMVIRRRRTDNSTHLNNTSQGAVATQVSLEEMRSEVIENCKKICYAMGREMAGVDVLEANDDSGRYVFLEVNAIPQLTSGVLINEKMQAFGQALQSEMKESV